MRMKDQLRFVRQNMTKTKSRVFMTVLATAMGCAFLIVLASVGFGLQKSIVDEVTEDRLVTEITVYGKEGTDHLNTELKAEDMDYLRSLDHVKAVTHTQYIRQYLELSVDGQKESAGSSNTVIDFESESKAGMELAAGRIPSAANEVLIGYHFQKRFTPDAASEPGAADSGTVVSVNTENASSASADGSSEQSNPIAGLSADEWIGKTIMTTVVNRDGVKKELALIVAGVRSPPSYEWNEDRSLYLGQGLLDEIEAFTGTLYGELPVQGQNQEEAIQPTPLTGERSFMNVTIVADHVKNVKSIAEEIRSNNYLNHSISDELDQVNMVFAIMNIGLIFVGTIAVLIASIGIYNTMTMAVTERTQDIGIMKAIGAHPKSIKAIFLLECAFIGLTGAAIGAIVSYGISFAANALLPVIIENFMDEKMPEGFVFSRIPFYLTLLSIAISLGVAVLSGHRPAARATRVDVLKALRRDV